MPDSLARYGVAYANGGGEGREKGKERTEKGVGDVGKEWARTGRDKNDKGTEGEQEEKSAV